MPTKAASNITASGNAKQIDTNIITFLGMGVVSMNNQSKSNMAFSLLSNVQTHPRPIQTCLHIKKKKSIVGENSSCPIIKLPFGEHL